MSLGCEKLQNQFSHIVRMSWSERVVKWEIYAITKD